ncbi:MAG: ABC transporter substrate-binding protein, partial [Actinomycetota bacterium]|nr:ABC transporter substrate-binding protein [Actinomycetota bacterium]
PIDPVTGAPVPGAAPGAVAPAAGCPDRAVQVPGDPYSPPCVAFSGANGGATSRGVTDKEIVVSVRQLEGPTAGEIFADLSGQPVISSPAAVQDTMVALAEYFSSRFQFYGRKLKLEFYKGQGSGSSELLGAGQDRALADAVRVAEEIGAFADISGITTPYANALSRQKVVNIGAPYPAKEWYQDRRPYAWSPFPDGTTVVDSLASWLQARMAGSPTVEFAGPELNGKPRVFGVVGPENPEYESSGDRFGSQLEGLDVAIGLNYRLDIASMPNQASNIIAQLKDAGVTTVVCACDPVMSALGMAPKAEEQGYHPEWITGGLAFVEQDLVAQLIDGSQWQRAFGLAFNAAPEPIGRSYPRSAYKTVRPGGEPAFGFEELYYQMYQLAIGIQMAGPELTPEAFERGMFAYPGATGPRGTWHFGPGDYTSVDDFREIWWDPKRISVQNSRPGAWVEINGGARWSIARPPSGPAPFFR